MSDLAVAVFSDVHGNLQGLQAVLADIVLRGVFNDIVAAGDHCLNGPDPAAAFDLVLSSATSILYGNTDRDIVLQGESDPDLGSKKADSIAWTRDQLGQERIERLDSLDFEFRAVAPDGTTLLVVHANPHDVDRHIFPDRSEEELQELIGDPGASMMAFGHLHIPFTRQVGETTLVNIAATGLPRDGDRRATWGEFRWSEATGWTSQTHRVEYDYRATVQRIFECGMPHPEKRAEDILKAVYD